MSYKKIHPECDNCQHIISQYEKTQYCENKWESGSPGFAIKAALDAAWQHDMPSLITVNYHMFGKNNPPTSTWRRNY